MCPFPSIRYSLAENAPANVADIYNFDPSFLPLEDHKSKLGHPNGQLDDHDGFGNLLNVDFFDAFGILDHDYNQINHEPIKTIAGDSERVFNGEGIVVSSYVNPYNKKFSSCVDPCNKKTNFCMDPCNEKFSCCVDSYNEKPSSYVDSYNEKPTSYMNLCNKESSSCIDPYNEKPTYCMDPCNENPISCVDPYNKMLSSCVDPCHKKLSHNTHERNRRKKQNALYAQLQALLPNPNGNRKLSIPKTVWRALKYIPELRCEIEKLRRQRDKLLIIKRISETAAVASKSKASREHLHSHDGFMCFPPNVTVNSAATEYSEVLVTIYTLRDAVLESSLLVLIEKEGFEVMDSSAFVSPHTICRILRLKMVRSTVNMEVLQKKILFLCGNGVGIEFLKPRLINCFQ